MFMGRLCLLRSRTYQSSDAQAAKTNKHVVILDEPDKIVGREITASKMLCGAHSFDCMGSLWPSHDPAMATSQAVINRPSAFGVVGSFESMPVGAGLQPRAKIEKLFSCLNLARG